MKIKVLVGTALKDDAARVLADRLVRLFPDDAERLALVSVRGDLGVGTEDEWLRRVGGGTREIAQDGGWHGAALNFEPNKQQAKADPDLADAYRQSFHDGAASRAIAALLEMSAVRMRAAAAGLRIGCWGAPQTRDIAGLLRTNMRYSLWYDLWDDLLPDVYARPGWGPDQAAARVRRALTVANTLELRGCSPCLSAMTVGIGAPPITESVALAQVEALAGWPSCTVWVDAAKGYDEQALGVDRILAAARRACG
ncbi:MAG: hypothetical protein AMXMBFR77_26810 [Phycisphaerales bacterium]